MSSAASHPDLDLGDRNAHVAVAKSILNSQGFAAGTGELFDERMQGAVVTFQGSHAGPDGKPLNAIGRVGRKTWWALYNPSGAAQRGYMQLVPGVSILPANIAAKRRAVVEAGMGLWRSNVREIPDGSNWGDGVSTLLRRVGQKSPAPWCAFTSSDIHFAGTGELLLGRHRGRVRDIWDEAVRRGWAFEKGSGYLPRPADLGVTLYRNSKGQLNGMGHIWHVIALGPRSGRGRAYNHLGGNEGNRLKLGLRNTADESLFGWVNPFGDHDQPACSACEVLPFAPNLAKAAEALAATR
jgi:hypothetical protein